MPENPTISSRTSVLLSQLCSEDRSSRRSSMPLTLQNTCIRHEHATCCDKFHCGNVTHTARTNTGMMDGRRRITSMGYKPRTCTSSAWPGPDIPPSSPIPPSKAFPLSPGDSSTMIFPKPALLTPAHSSSPPRSVTRVVRMREPVRALDAKSNGPPNNSSGEELHSQVEEKRHQEQYMRGRSGEKKVTSSQY